MTPPTRLRFLSGWLNGKMCIDTVGNGLRAGPALRCRTCHESLKMVDGRGAERHIGRSLRTLTSKLESLPLGSPSGGAVSPNRLTEGVLSVEWYKIPISKALSLRTDGTPSVKNQRFLTASPEGEPRAQHPY